MNPSHDIGLAGIIELVHPQSGPSSVLYPRWDALAAVEQFLSWGFNCRLTLRVNTITGLASAFNGSGLLVHWERRGDEDMVAGPARVTEGVAEFEQQLDRTCFIRCSRAGPYLTAIHREHFLIYASVDGQVGFDLGVHRIDVTEIHGTMLEENRQRRWNATYELQGEAAGAVMNVSFECRVLEDDPSTAPGSSSSRELEITPEGPDETPTRTNSQGPTRPEEDQPSGDGGTRKSSQGLATPTRIDEGESPHEPTIPPTPSDSEGDQTLSASIRSQETPLPPTKSPRKPFSCCFGCCSLFKGCFC